MHEQWEGSLLYALISRFHHWTPYVQGEGVKVFAGKERRNGLRDFACPQLSKDYGRSFIEPEAAITSLLLPLASEW